ncbi:hypothetical protein G6F31_017099 [Rhizopus arrhizus]|nr:hypothetical protein G6F31_017099 [Rhizopus arrhizus]
MVPGGVLGGTPAPASARVASRRGPAGRSPAFSHRTGQARGASLPGAGHATGEARPDDLTVRRVQCADASRKRCTTRTDAAPSPMQASTCLTEPARTAPAAKPPGGELSKARACIDPAAARPVWM